MIGVRAGVTCGARCGAAAGSATDPSNGTGLAGNGVAQDGLSGILVPASVAQWAAVLASAGVSTSAVPSAIWRFQDTSGSISDTFGSLPLTVAGTAVTYQAAVAGWSRRAVVTADTGTTTMLSASASLPNIQTTSASVLTYSRITAGAAARSRVALGTTFIADGITTGGVSSLQITGVGVTNGTLNESGVVRPTWLTINRTASAESLVNNLEKVTATFSTVPIGKGIQFGSAVNLAGSCSYLYAALFVGAAAEITDSQRAAVLRALGWSMGWS
jgi:hypothetical protein